MPQLMYNCVNARQKSMLNTACRLYAEESRIGQRWCWMEEEAMRCSIEGCPGDYEARAIVHTVRHDGDVIVNENVPAEVCSVCGDVLLAPETVRHIEALLRSRPRPISMVPLYEYA
jgi:YgiT-type zinc finger domain-containing protein